MSEYQRQYYRDHREAYLARAREQYANDPAGLNRKTKERLQNPERKAQRDARWTAWYKANALKRREYDREWRRRNPDKLKAQWAVTRLNRAARERAAAGSFSYVAWMEKVEYYGWRCVYCKTGLDHSTLTIDHFKALANGGSNWVANLVPACLSCNSRKRAKKVLPQTVHSVR